MGQPISILDKGEREKEKRDDAKLSADMEKQREKNKRKERVSNDRKSKQEKLNSKISPISQETKPSTNNTLMTKKSVCTVVGVNKKNDLDKLKARGNVHCCEKKREYSGNKETKSNIDKYNGESARKDSIEVEETANKHGNEVKARQIYLFDDENNAQEKPDEIKVAKAKHGDEKSEQQLPVDFFKLQGSQGNVNNITVHRAIIQEPSRNTKAEPNMLNKIDGDISQANEKYESKLKPTERDRRDNLVDKEGLRKTEIYLYAVSRKKCAQLIFVNSEYLEHLLQTVTCKHSFKSLLVPYNWRIFEHVYAIGVPSTSPLLYSSGDQLIIKRILKEPRLKNFYLQHEHFRLATFSLSPQRYKKGEILRLAASGFYYDIDGHIRCFCCGSTGKTSGTVTHQPHCLHQTGTSISQYGASALNILLQNENVTRGEHRLAPSDYVQVRVRLTRNTVRLGGTEPFSTEERNVHVEERCVIYSIRRGRIQYTYIPSQNGETNWSVSSNRHPSPQDVENEILPTAPLLISERSDESASQTGDANRTSCQYNGRVPPVEERSQECHTSREGPRRVPRPCEGERTIKEDVNRRLTRENDEMRSRLLCLKCQRRLCNVVLLPCGHLVVCDTCIENTMECPSCGQTVDNAVHTVQ